MLEDARRQLRKAAQGIHVVHIVTENIFFPELGKGIADLIEGRVVTAEVLCS